MHSEIQAISITVHCYDSNSLSTEAGLLAVDEIESAVLFVDQPADGAVVSIRHDANIERPIVTWIYVKCKN